MISTGYIDIAGYCAIYTDRSVRELRPLQEESMTRSDNLPYQFLLKASGPTLESFELSRLNHAANLKKQISDLIDQYLDETTAALLARAMIMRMNCGRPHSVPRKQKSLAPRPLASARSVSAARTISAEQATLAKRAASSERSLFPARVMASDRALPRCKSSGFVEVENGASFNLFSTSHVR
jgi:hypothetical protein